MFPAGDGFKVSDRVSEKNRYVARKWTQKELEAALSSPFNARKKLVHYEKEKNDDLNTNYEKESDTARTKNNVFLPTEKIENAPSQFARKLSNIDERLNKLEENLAGEKQNSSNDSRNSVNELERSKDSEAAVKLDEECNIEPPNDTIETSGHDGLVCFLDSCLQCLFNIGAFKDKVSQTLESESHSPLCSELYEFLKVFGQTDNSNEQFCFKEKFPSFFEMIVTQSKSCDEALTRLLHTLLHDSDNQCTENEFRSLIQGKFCHARLCAKCETVVREYEAFTFLNPYLPVQLTPQKIMVNFMSCAKDRIWKTSVYEVPIPSGELMVDFKEQLVQYLPGNLEASSIEIGAVSGRTVTEIYEDTENLCVVSTLDANSKLFAFSVVNSGNSHQQKRYSVDTMSYHLYFSCGLCLNDGKEHTLLMHRACGGMVCQDCLDEISRASQDWESSLCPVCERPINLTKDICPAHFGTDKPDAVPCIILFRTDGHKNTTTDLFGTPMLLTLPQETTGYQLYREIGSIFPKKLPLKSKTSFTIHMVTKTGQRCAAKSCTTPNCTGCLVKINDTIILQPFTYMVVHFGGENLPVKWRQAFGEQTPNNQDSSSVSKAQMLFDSILRSCADASPSSERLCPKCCEVMSSTVTSISNFPQLLMIHLNHQFASQGLPQNMCLTDVARFVTVERNNMDAVKDAEQSFTYQLTAAVLQEGNGTSLQPTYKSYYISGRHVSTWLAQDGINATETDPNRLYLTSDGVLFYEPVQHHTQRLPYQPGNTDEDASNKNGLTWPVDVQWTGTSPPRSSDINDDQCDGKKRRSQKGTVVARRTHHHHPQQACTTNTKTRSAQADTLEPGEYPYFSGKDGVRHKNHHLGLEKASLAYGSGLSLGEVKNPATTGHLNDGFYGIDTISPIIATTDMSKPESVSVGEARNLITAVKMEDAYGIVCSLKKGADPCLLVNDVTALHLAAGSKSDQRASILTYLLKYADDVNVATSDGTTPIHVAAAWGHQDAVEILLRYGGDPFERTDIEGNSAFDLASKDCSIFLQSVYSTEPNSTRVVGFSATGSRKPTPAHDSQAEKRRLEDIVRSNVTLPSFVHEPDSRIASSVHGWLQRLRSFRRRSTGVFRNLRKMSTARRRRSRIGVMVMDGTRQKPPKNQESNSK